MTPFLMGVAHVHDETARAPWDLEQSRRPSRRRRT
jgi:hypothetical protein